MAGKQPKFLVSRAKGARFEPMTGFRDWLSIRDLGLEDATHGEYRAFITRANEMGHATGAHYHEMDFQIIYVLKGWVKFHCAGEGEMTWKRATSSIIRRASSTTCSTTPRTWRCSSSIPPRAPRP